MTEPISKDCNSFLFRIATEYPLCMCSCHFDKTDWLKCIFWQACVHALTKQEASTGIEKNEIGLEVEQTTSKFIDLARQMESFFIQKRFLLSALKPELMLKEENLDLRYEINRKDELIKKHYERIELWKNMLSDQQQQQHPPPHPPHMPPVQVPGMPPIGHVGMPPSDLRPMPMGMQPKNAPGPMAMGGMSAMQVSRRNDSRRDTELIGSVHFRPNCKLNTCSSSNTCCKPSKCSKCKWVKHNSTSSEFKTNAKMTKISVNF